MLKVKGEIRPNNQVQVRYGGQMFVANVLKVESNLATMSYQGHVFNIDLSV